QRFERWAVQDADCTVAVSDVDRDRFCADFGARQVEVVENGVNTAYFQPSGATRCLNQVLFLGSLDWRANLDGVEQLLSVVFPALRQLHPGASLCLVGRNPPEALRQRVAGLADVTLHASVPDVRPFLARCALMVVPLRVGGGSRLKILEALASGVPV